MIIMLQKQKLHMHLLTQVKNNIILWHTFSDLSIRKFSRYCTYICQFPLSLPQFLHLEISHQYYKISINSQSDKFKLRTLLS